jgi:hypothetical protein
VANTFAPFGFQQWSGLGSSPTYEQSSALIASTNGTKIFFGDPVVYVTSTATGYIKQATAGTVAILGIFTGCKYLSTSQKRTVWSNYWPGADATGDVTAYVITDPAAQFKVQTGNSSTTATAIGNSKVGQLINLATAVDNVSQTGGSAGNTSNGLSTMYADQNTVGTTATLPFMIRSTIVDPPGTNGTDLTTPYNWIVVGFNNAMFQGGGARTGIS